MNGTPLWRPRRFLGLAVMIMALIGLLGSVLALVSVPRVSTQLVTNTQDGIDETVALLETTSQMLGLIDDVLGEAADTLDETETTLNDVGQSIDNSEALFTSVDNMLTEELPTILESTRTSLESAQDSAAVIEEVLAGFNVISGLTGVSYEPEEPLADSLGTVAESLIPLPETLSQTATDLDASYQDLDAVATDLTSVATNLADARASLEEAQTLLSDYQATVEQSTTRLSSLSERLPGEVQRTQWIAIFLLVWFGLSQVGLLAQGWEMLRDDHSRFRTRFEQLEAEVSALQAQASQPSAAAESSPPPTEDAI